MKRQTVQAAGAAIELFCLDGDSTRGGAEMVWAHGWAQTHAALLPLAQAMRRSGRSRLLDLPGFGGASPEPPHAWSTADYADAVADWLAAADAAPAPSPASGGRLGWGSGANSDNDRGAPAYPHPNPPPRMGEGTVERPPPLVVGGTPGNPSPQAGEGRVGVSPRRRIWIGYSYGGRVGLQLAARHPDALDALCLIAAPGLPAIRSPVQRARITARNLAFRLVRGLTPEGPARERLRARFGSGDYVRATPLMRQVLVKAVNEDLSAAARAVRVPALLIYGDQDRDASLDIGMRLNTLIPQSRLVALRGFGHLDIVSDGQHQVVQRLGEFLEQLG